MSKEQAVIEIRNSAIKLLVGYLNDNEGKVNLLYNETIPLEEDILGAYITSKENVIKELSKIIHLKTNDGLKININEATIVYPSFGLNVYSSIGVSWSAVLYLLWKAIPTPQSLQ